MRTREPTRGEWSALAEAAGNVFGTPEWCETWLEHFGRGRPHAVIGLAHGDGPVAAVLPVYRAARVPCRIWRFAGHGPGDETGPVCADADRRAAWEAAGAALAGLGRGWDVLLGDDLPADTAWTVAGARRLVRRPSPVLRLPQGDWEELLAARSPKLRRDVRRGERRLARLGVVRHRVTRRPDDLERDFETFLALHRARWRGRSHSFAGRTAFHRDFAARALARGWLRLRFLELDGRPVAALYNLRFAGAESNYQAGRDRAYDRWGVGLQLQALAIRDSLATGAKEYRWLRGGEPYKLRFADRDAGVETVALARGASGRAAAALLGAERSLPRPVRRVLPRGLAWGSGGAQLRGGA